jgi:Fe(II)/alpha-ketoglutarate-dependent arginine beta-hydroxylase
MSVKTRIHDEPSRFQLSPAELAVIDQLVARACETYPSAESDEFLRAAVLDGQELPRRLRDFLLEMRSAESAAACVVSGFAVDDAAVGPTPHDWAGQPDRHTTLREEIWLVLCGSVLGDIFGWATQQDGALVHDIMPVRGFETSQLGTGSDALLWWHTEEAFHPYRCDYLGLLCLRNPDKVATTFSSIAGVQLDDELRTVLFEPRFVIRPDDSHLDEDRQPAPRDGKQARLLADARRRLEQMNRAPAPVAVLYGDPEDPYLAIDPFYMEVADTDGPARRALAAISRELDERTQEVALRPGEILLIDNFRAVHGRKPFQARYDGTDRWLKRINITRDLRKSRSQRASCDSRVVY